MKHNLSFLLICITLCSVLLCNATDSKSFSIQNITFKSHGIDLAGTIFIPKRSYAAVVLVHGSGQEKRMSDLGKQLAENGIAVLTYDKRGVGESGGIYVGPEVGSNNIDRTNLNLLASDVSEAVNKLVDYLPEKTPIGLLGFSQAGWIIPLATRLNSQINFMVVFSGPVVSTLEQLRFQFYTNGDQSFWQKHNEAEARLHIQNDPDKYIFDSFHPVETLDKLTVPGLWLFGGKDVQIPVSLSAENLNKLKHAGKPYNFLIFPELGHNTGFSKSNNPLFSAIKWIRNLHQ